MKLLGHSPICVMQAVASTLLIASIVACEVALPPPSPIARPTTAAIDRAQMPAFPLTATDIPYLSRTPSSRAASPLGPSFQELQFFHTGSLQSLDWAPSGDAIAALSYGTVDEFSSTITLFDLSDDLRHWSTWFDYGDALAFSPAGAVIAVPHPTKDMVQLFDAENGLQLEPLDCGDASARCNGGDYVAFLPDGLHLLTATFSEGGGAIYEWDVIAGSFLGTLALADGTIFDLSMSPTGEWFTTDLADLETGKGVVSAWAYPSGELKCMWPGRSSAPLGEDDQVAIATGQVIAIYDVRTCQELSALSGTQSYIVADPLGALLAAITLDRDLTIYDLQSQEAGPTQRVEQLGSSRDGFVAMDFNRDGSLLAIGEEYGVRVLQVILGVR